MESVHSRG
jgi:hypothetical protein